MEDKRNILKAALIIIFNHKYENNLPRLRMLYQNRFSIVRFLMPFYTGNDADIIPVYENSYQFQGYYIQAYPKLMKLECDCFLFIADDMQINPVWNEHNICSLLRSKKILLDRFDLLNAKNKFLWSHSKFAARAFLSRGCNWQRELPSFDEAKEKLERFTNEPCSLLFDEEFFGNAISADPEAVEAFRISNGGDYQVKYPLVMGYSDYFMLRKENLFELSHLCGIFASMNLFVEIAFPTAVMLTFEREDVLFLQETEYGSNIIWEAEEKEKLKTDYHCSLKTLFERWPEKLFNIHPVKLSEWN